MPTRLHTQVENKHFIMNKTPAFSICVYCGSRNGVSPRYVQVAQEVGQWIGSHQGQLVYGGGENGLMGLVAKSTMEAGGRVVGIIPTALQSKEKPRIACDELHVVDTMHERKQMMAERADAFLALPGGIGTFEEFFEIWTWRQLGYHDKPIGLLNTEGYYDGLLAFAKSSVEQGFLSDSQMSLIKTGPDATELLRILVQDAGFSPQALAAGL